jgi:hypothetical protein
MINALGMINNLPECCDCESVGVFFVENEDNKLKK